MTPVKSSDPTTARLEQPNIDEAEKNDLKREGGGRRGGNRNFYNLIKLL